MRIRTLGLALAVAGALGAGAGAQERGGGKRDGQAKERSAEARSGGRLTADAVNDAGFEEIKGDGASPVLLRAQVLLDRARFSPGTIDARQGSNMERAVSAFARANDLGEGGKLTKEVFERLVATSGDPVLTEYTVTAEDVKGPFESKIPGKMEEMAGLERLAYTGPEELLAERFHASVDLLKVLNPGKSLDREGETLLVPAVDFKAGGRGQERGQGRGQDKAEQGSKEQVARIEVDKTRRELRAFGKDDRLVASYPASIGSEEKPAPDGSHRVEAVARNPTYTYNPDYAFKGVTAKEKFTIKPGPNNPVGTVWIDLSIPSYGIHGTPDPDRVGKAYSHGCVRLTNWDVEELAGMVRKGVKVDFVQ